MWARVRKILFGLLHVIVALPLSSTSCGGDRCASVRVNQLGYELGFPMRAYFMVARAQPEAKFVVRNSNGETSYSATVGQKVGTWGDYMVFRLDFAVTAPGTYTVTVIGAKQPVTTPALRVDRPAKLYSAALANTLS